ncbi:MAG: hypothetical protein NUV80_02940 [Candidatus Berkelbacteria bacterium]|nr:hypothetical protein [Candidatus Berkelbacteria bacterium]
MNTIKGAPLHKWDEVLAVQHEPLVYIVSNGSKWAGESPDDVANLLQVLTETPLDPSFENYGNFICPDPCEGVRDNGKWVDGKRLFDVSMTHFHGNFFTLSHVFSIYTNDPETIQALTKAIKENQATKAYKEAKTALFAHRKTKRRA